MKDIALHILDITENSVRAKATEIRLTQISDNNGILEFHLTDNGCGIAPDMLATITDPFTTSRTTRKVGMGLSLLRQNVDRTNGSFQIQSELNVGTQLIFSFNTSHIDCLPVGDMAGVLSILITSNPQVLFTYKLTTPVSEFEISTHDITEQLDGLPLGMPEVVKFVKEYIAENYAAAFPEIRILDTNK